MDTLFYFGDGDYLNQTGPTVHNPNVTLYGQLPSSDQPQLTNQLPHFETVPTQPSVTQPAFEIVPDFDIVPEPPAFEIVPDFDIVPEPPAFEIVPDFDIVPEPPAFEIVPDNGNGNGNGYGGGGGGGGGDYPTNGDDVPQKAGFNWIILLLLAGGIWAASKKKKK